MSSSTRSFTQNILIPSHSSSNFSSNFKNMITSLFNKKTNKISDNREDLLLDDVIENMYLGFEKIGLPIHGFTDITLFLPRIFLPSVTPIVSGKTFYHASLLLETENNYSIVVEYGGYYGEDMTDKDDTTYKTYYWFEKSHGLRYAEMSYHTYKYYKIDVDSYSERIFPLECGRKRTIRQLLKKCNENKKWTFSNYDLAFQNCQHFVALFIKNICGYRRKKTSFRGLHNISSVFIPRVILNEIEKNEDDNWNTVGKIPVLGPIIGLIYAIAEY